MTIIKTISEDQFLTSFVSTRLPTLALLDQCYSSVDFSRVFQSKGGSVTSRHWHYKFTTFMHIFCLCMIFFLLLYIFNEFWMKWYTWWAFLIYLSLYYLSFKMIGMTWCLKLIVISCYFGVLCVKQKRRVAVSASRY